MVATWAFATLFHGGKLGPWNDDYFFTLIDPVTLTIGKWALTTREPYLPETGVVGPWRPLLFTAISWLISLSWKHFFIAHVFGACMHAVNTGLLFVLLRKLGRSAHAAWAASGLFLCWGVHSEAFSWPSAYGSLMSACMLLLATLAHTRFATLPLNVRDGARAWFLSLLMLVSLTLLILGFNEQATGALGGLVLAYLAVAPSDERWLKRLWRSVFPVACACVLVPLYVLAVRKFGQPGLGSNVESYVPVHELGGRIISLLGQMLNVITFGDLWYPAFGLGWREWVGKNSVFFAWLGALVVSGLVSLRVWVKYAAHKGEQVLGGGRSAVRHWLVFAFGVLGGIGACLPVAVIAGYPPLSRVTYVVILLWVVALACVFDAAIRLCGRLIDAVSKDAVLAAARARTARRFFGIFLGIAMIHGSVVTIGMQTRHKRVTEKDAVNGAELVKQVPDPLAQTVFLPLAVRPRDVQVQEIVLLHPFMKVSRIERKLEKLRPQVESFARVRQSVWEGLWSMRFFVKFLYRRDDVQCLYANPGHQLIVDADDAHVRFIWPFGAGWEAPAIDPKNPADINALIPWSHVVPLDFDPDGSLKVVTHVRVVRGSGENLREFVIEVPQVKGKLPRREATIMIPHPPEIKAVQ